MNRSLQVFLWMFCCIGILEKTSGQFVYINPVPGSIYQNPSTNILLRNGNLIDSTSLSPQLFIITGSVSGGHAAIVYLSDDQKTIQVYPEPFFADSETVTVTVLDGIRTQEGQSVGDTSFEFQTHPHYYFGRNAPKGIFNLDGVNILLKPSQRDAHREQQGPRFPEYTITSNGNEYPSEVFYYNFKSDNSYDTTGDFRYRTILKNNGDSVFGKYNDVLGLDFKLNHNGYLTYYDAADSNYDMMDSAYRPIDSFFAGNGYRADNHDFQIFPDGHSYLLCYDEQIVDLSTVVNNGVDTAHVMGLILQELDKKKRVVFEWRSWDHYYYKDTYELLHNHSFVDLVHGNSIELTKDGNILISARHLSEVTKINHETGEIIWRLGGRNNQFTFVNDIDTLHFWYQHDARELPNGHITLFDNNTQRGIPSCVKEYAIDEVNKTATLVWHYVHPDLDSSAEIFSNAMGNAERLPNGNTFICWGFFFPQANVSYPNFTEVDSLGNIVWEFRFSGEEGYIAYRAFKFNWNQCTLPIPVSLQANNITANAVDLSWSVPPLATEYEIEYKEDTSSNWVTISTPNNPYSLTGLKPQTRYNWKMKTICSNLPDSSEYSTTQYFTTIDVDVASLPRTSFEFYPNPASNAIKLNFTLEKSNEVMLCVTDLLGKPAIVKKWIAKQGANTKEIKLPMLPQGTYILTFQTDQGDFRNKLIIQ